jgi:hypothetical protein
MPVPPGKEGCANRGAIDLPVARCVSLDRVRSRLDAGQRSHQRIGAVGEFAGGVSSGFGGAVKKVSEEPEFGGLV